jgi:hypothetical protein
MEGVAEAKTEKTQAFILQTKLGSQRRRWSANRDGIKNRSQII